MELTARKGASGLGSCPSTWPWPVNTLRWQSSCVLSWLCQRSVWNAPVLIELWQRRPCLRGISNDIVGFLDDLLDPLSSQLSCRAVHLALQQFLPSIGGRFP